MFVRAKEEVEILKNYSVLNLAFPRNSLTKNCVFNIAIRHTCFFWLFGFVK